MIETECQASRPGTMSIDDLILSAANTWLAVTNRKLVRGFRRSLGRRPDFIHLPHYTDRMLWRKLVDRNPDFVVFSDKLGAKEYMKRMCPDLPLPRTLWVGSSADDIPEELLLKDVFVKTNHGSSFNFRTRGVPCDRAVLRELTNKWLATSYGEAGGEWPYAFVERKLFVEEPVGDAETDLLEFQIRASHGKPLLGSLIGRRKLSDQWVYYLDDQGAVMTGVCDSVESAANRFPPGLKIAEPYFRAVEFTRRLSVGVDYARFDYFWSRTGMFGGEITLFPGGGGVDFGQEVDAHLCHGWDMRQSHFLKTPQTGWKGLYAGALRRRLERSRQINHNQPP